MRQLQKIGIGREDIRDIGGKFNDLVDAVSFLLNLKGEGCQIDNRATGLVVKVPEVPRVASGASSPVSTLWKLEKSGDNIISKNALALWYSELVLQATENTPLTWTAPALGASLYVDVYYDTSWHYVATTSAGSTAGHQYFLVGKTDSSGNPIQYQSGILWIGDRYQ